MSIQRRILAFLLGCLVAAGAAAQGTWPSKPITIIVPYGAGGTNDIIARMVAARLTAALGQSVVVENKPGAGGNLGAQFVARAPADGYTLLTAPVSLLSINKWVYPNLGFDPEKDLAPITMVGRVPNVLLVNPAVPAANVDELVRYAKANPKKLSFASMGSGTSGHLSGEMFKMLANVDMQHIPYKGSAPALNDLLGGHVQMMFDNLPTALPQVKAGKLRAFAVTSTRRNPLLPDVPTLAEAGVRGFDATAWFGFVAPAATPPAILDRLNTEIVKALNERTFRAELVAQGVEVEGNTRAEFATLIADESRKWKQVVDRSGAKAD
ncbi:Bug family tripartite tricarboxylate transporter substrate binding protein [Ramlibacter humi]|uniref:Tripartite tricarboxylate transporter substrate binding protein n=1 Tax=Ramlibacter humi TaxID=2530451 RepID=A0A4Z0BES3_9BURK|nr:tripartite tricarboxylate transporter substrate binding protein [Ramlibacter humi]TFY96604.1 tripartite tricarboxylate transporter substrate binding protein [Ramlibacter humi]